ncbi:hypothetical protein A8C56_01730 [Niabella ginsenosidivorans]|uniref:Uncharacterized protein n=1 Tax=Niabella ginsenosidivorans TaxID=1176587 RepID=A0A1A9HXR0_9BACT|nr:hypothetical protein A8C56_01730 [Niabella ginsenosidivorans]
MYHSGRNRGGFFVSRHSSSVTGRQRLYRESGISIYRSDRLRRSAGRAGRYILVKVFQLILLMDQLVKILTIYILTLRKK